MTVEPIQVWDGDGVSPVDRQLIEKLRELPAHMGTDMLFGMYQMPVIKSKMPFPKMSLNDLINTTPIMTSVP